MALFAHPLRHQWDDLSDYVVHLTRDQGQMSAEFALVGILRGGEIEARSRFGPGRRHQHCPQTLCLTEAPLHQLKRIADRRSQYGFGFTKQFVLGSGGGPVFYAYGDQGAALVEIMQAAANDAAHPIWRAAAFFEQPQPGNAFEWEREWRVAGRLPFGVNDLRFITAPEDQHEAMRRYFDEEHAAGNMRDYRCPLIDLAWDAERIYAALGRRRPGP